MENRIETPGPHLRIGSTLTHIGQWFYGSLFWIALAMQLLSSLATWNSTITYDYFCGNPLMESWARWFIISMVAGTLILPTGLWAIRHRDQRRGVLFLAGFSLYLISMIFMLIAGAIFGIVPDFIDFIGYTFG